MSVERLRDLLETAARGSFPPPEWGLEFVPAPPRLLGAVVAFTGHHVISADVSEEEARTHLDIEDIAAPFNPAFLCWLGERLGAHIGHIDATLACLGTGAGDDWLQPLCEPPENERVRRARNMRADVEYLGPPDGGAVVILGEGLASRRELSMEITEESHRNVGWGTRLVRAAVDRTPMNDALFASVAPGNARSLRCLLRAGFRPIGAECILTTRGA